MKSWVFAEAGDFVEPASMSLDVVDRRSRVSLTTRGVQLTGWVTAPDLIAARPIAFEGGFVLGVGGSVKTNSDADGRLWVVPTERRDLERLKPWPARTVGCDDVEISAVRRPRQSEAVEHPVWLRAASTIQPTLDAENLYRLIDETLATVREKRGNRIRIRAFFRDGSHLDGWTTGEAVTERTPDGWARGSDGSPGAPMVHPPPTSCPVELALAVETLHHGTAVVGKMQAGTRFDLRGSMDGWSSITFRDLLGIRLVGEHSWAVPTTNLKSCTPDLSAAHESLPLNTLR